MKDKRPHEIFIAFAEEDSSLVWELEKHLMYLERIGYVSIWHHHHIRAGANWEKELEQHLEEADIILLLISADFFASSEAIKIMETAVTRHRRGEARVVPVIVSPCYWRDSPIGMLQVLPRNGKPITFWSNKDAAFNDVTMGIRRLVASMARAHPAPLEMSSKATVSAAPLSVTRNHFTTKRVKKRVFDWLVWLIIPVTPVILAIATRIFPQIAVILLVAAGIIILGAICFAVFAEQLLSTWPVTLLVLGGNLCAHLRLYKIALRAYKLAIDLGPQLSRAYRGQNKVYKKLGQLESAKLLRRAQHARERAEQLGVDNDEL